MRLDELPRSDKVEDRRGDGPGGFSMGRAGGCPRFNKADLPIYCLLGSAPSSQSVQMRASQNWTILTWRGIPRAWLLLEKTS
jgi:hypothetical protein